MTIHRNNYSPLKLGGISPDVKSATNRKSSLGGMGPITPFDQAAGKLFGVGNSKDKSKDDKYSKANKLKRKKMRQYLNSIFFLFVLCFCYMAFKKFIVNSLIKVPTTAVGSNKVVADSVNSPVINNVNSNNQIPQDVPSDNKNQEEARQSNNENSDGYKFKKQRVATSNRAQELLDHGLNDAGDLICDNKECFSKHFIAVQNDWNEIRRGQIISEFVEVRLNVNTGKHEGRLRPGQAVPETKSVEIKNEDDSFGVSAELYPTVVAALRDRIIVDREKINYSNSNFDSYLGELLNPYSVDTYILSALDHLEKKNFNFYSGVLDGEGIEVLLLLIQREGDPMVRQRAASILSSIMDDNHEAQLEATKHRVFNVLLKALKWEKDGHSQVAIMDAIINVIKYNHVGLKVFFTAKGFDSLIQIYELADVNHKQVKRSIVTFAAEIFHFERTMLEESVPVDVQDRGIHIKNWCNLLQKHFIDTSDDAIIALEALEGLMSTSYFNHGVSGLCAINEDFKLKFAQFNPDTKHPYAFSLKTTLIRLIKYSDEN